MDLGVAAFGGVTGGVCCCLVGESISKFFPLFPGLVGSAWRTGFTLVPPGVPKGLEPCWWCMRFFSLELMICLTMSCGGRAAGFVLFLCA